MSHVRHDTMHTLKVPATDVQSLDAKRIILIGPMASGKTSIGRHLAGLLKWSFIDTDQAIEQASGADIATIFALEGEAGFRGREHLQLAALTQRTQIVIATGGGVVLMPENHALLTHESHIVLTVVSLDRQFARAKKIRNRPLLHQGDPGKVLEETWKARQSLYYSLAHTIIDTSFGSPRDVAVRLHAQLVGRSIS